MAAQVITQVSPGPTSSSPITQVSQTAPPALAAGNGAHLLTRLRLELRGTTFNVDREAIMSLPESVLLCLFPNGLVLSRPEGMGTEGEEEEEERAETYYVDFDPDCFAFVLRFFREAQEHFYGTPTSPGGLLAAQQHLLDSPAPSIPSGPGFLSPSAQNPLLVKQAIIVLREELEYFAIPPRDDGHARTDQNGRSNDHLLQLKRECGRLLLEKRNIFTALQRNVNKENNIAEQHLIDMLCMSGFDRSDTWGYRAVEPGRSCISSIALVLLKTGISHPPASSHVTIDHAQMATAQKLLLFWRKPARKCWWDGIDLDLPPIGQAPARRVRLWSRRVWTLELSLV
ncbi:hypothetical protein DACRYDRAFT_24673 [Dacryopinax primogenitus]|uniref:Phosphatase activator n=1 Tax=Dacryopinax primogenitus (strain DJM 731) TaxID=1858805 RepID=M5FP31_DACPD|nr:uncharacterized protein DACRYDRAFT_24673 [Dacryopinax primogenitus]EJT98175.1 hypothetical protein DACRYDRAFT_24673 [Dacryopinax primogenitus]